MSLRRKRVIAWVAATLVALNAFWPLIAQAAPKAPSLLVPICSMEGKTHHVDLSSGKTPLGERRASHGEHCKLCVFGSDRTAALPAEAVALLAVVAIVAEPSFARPVPLSEPLSHTPAQPRAPPALS
jgi:hypothetical protein